MATNAAVNLTNTPDEIAKIEVATCTRLLNFEGILGYSGHVSVRLPNRKSLLIQSFDATRADLKPEDLFTVDLDGNVIHGPAEGRPVNEIEIHSEIMRARDNVNAVLHYHPEVATLFTMIEGVDLIPMKNHAMRWSSGIPVHPDSWHIDTQEAGKELAETLGPHHAALMRSHGAVITSESIPALMVDTVHFEENAKAMYDAMQLGKAIPMSEAEMERFHDLFERQKHVVKLWRYYLTRGVRGDAIPKQWSETLFPTERV